MIKVTIEIWPGGDGSRRRTLATAVIHNNGCGSPWLGIYLFKLFGKDGRKMREGAVGEFRRQDFSVWWLVAAVLKTAFPDVDKTFRDRRVVGRLT